MTVYYDVIRAELINSFANRDILIHSNEIDDLASHIHNSCSDVFDSLHKVVEKEVKLYCEGEE